MGDYFCSNADMGCIIASMHTNFSSRQRQAPTIWESLFEFCERPDRCTFLIAILASVFLHGLVMSKA
jgi:hypothetical protein